MGDEIIGGLISGGGSLLGSAIGSVSQYYTNKTNKEIAEANNMAMLQAMREQTKSEQDYNSASAQMKRAQIAGLNPMTLAGSQPTSASSSGVPGLDTPVMQNPFLGFRTGLNELGSAMIQGKQFDLQDRNLDIADLEAKIELMRVTGDLLKNSELTADDVNGIVKSIFGDSPQAPQFTSMFKDEYVKKRLIGEVELSDLSLKEKKYLYDWLDEFTNARYLMLLAETENQQTGSSVNRSRVRLDDSQISLNEVLKGVNEEKKKEIIQAIENMEAQWYSLDFQGKLDAEKLKRVAEISDAIVDDLVNSAKISKNEAEYFVWSTLLKSNNFWISRGFIPSDPDKPFNVI